jgi:pyruvate dehydrogenase E1 component alpha subunit
MEETQTVRTKTTTKVPALSKASKKTTADRGAKSAKEPVGDVLREDCETVLAEDGKPQKGKDVRLAPELLLRMYRNMVMTRAFDERGMMLQRQGRIGFYLPSFGQEAIQTGTAAALGEKDWVFPSYREQGVFLFRGASLYKMFCNLWGNSEDNGKGRQMPVHYSFPEHRLFSVSSPIATQVIQGVGAAMAAKIRGEKDIAITYCGDGGTSENDFHTGLTFAGAMKAPAVFVVTNNQFAISVPFHKQTGCRRLVDKAVGYGMPGVAVDGNDILAVYRATKEAVDRARAGGGPSFIECFTYRMGPHSSSDDPTRYRDEKVYEAWRKRDPIPRFRNYLEHLKLWDAKKETALLETLKEEIARAIEQAEPVPPPAIEDLFDDVYAKRTPQLEKQRAAMVRERELRGTFEDTSGAFPL